MKQPRWDPGLDVLALPVLRAGLGQCPQETAPLNDVDWSKLTSTVARHRLQGLLVSAVANRQIAATADQRAEIALRELDLTRDRFWHDVRLLQVTASLEDAGIEYRVLKGPAFGSLDYPDRIMRPTGDVDLLLRGNDLMAAVDTLCDEGASLVDPDPVDGYSREIGKSKTVTMPDGLEVDLHRILVRGPFGVKMRTDDLWATSRPFEVGGVPMATLGLEESLMHACYHLMILSDKRALSIRDVAQFLVATDLDSTRVVDLADRWQASVVLGGAVLLVARMIPAFDEHPLVLWANSFRPGPISRWNLRIAEPGNPIGPAEWPATLLALDSNAHRLLLIKSIIKPLPGTNDSFGNRLRRLVRRTLHTSPPFRLRRHSGDTESSTSIGHNGAR